MRADAVAQHHGGDALTRRTSKAALVVLGNSIALYNPPLRVAEEEFAMLDVLSGGRLVAGFPVGTSMDTNYAYGDDTGAHAREICRGARPHSQGEGRPTSCFAFNGRYTKLRYVNCWPEPIQRPAPPIFIPGGGWWRCTISASITPTCIPTGATGAIRVLSC